MPKNSPLVCVPCRRVTRHEEKCAKCGAPTIRKHYSWRAPRRRNKRAWELIEKGVWLWDGPAIDHAKSWFERVRRRNAKYRQSEIEVDYDRPTRPLGKL